MGSCVFGTLACDKDGDGDGARDRGRVQCRNEEARPRVPQLWQPITGTCSVEEELRTTSLPCRL